jgi:hypothetical protein
MVISVSFIVSGFRTSMNALSEVDDWVRAGGARRGAA